MSKNTISSSKLNARAVAAICLSVLLFCANMIAVNATQTQQQPARVSVQFGPNSVTGTCTVNGETLLLETQRLTQSSSISRVRHPDGRILIEAFRNVDTITFRFANAEIVVNIANQTFDRFSEQDQAVLQEFLQTRDATLVRSCVSSLLQTLRQTRGPRGRRVLPLGLALIGMLLGEEPSSISSSRPNTGLPLQCPASMRFAFSSRSNFAGVGLSRTATRPVRNANSVGFSFQDPYTCPIPDDPCYGGSDCNGCCGVGCTGCDYYTYECLVHDNCVDTYGHAACMGTFPAAAGSLARAIRKGSGDWGPSTSTL